jgi:hypothetical protein
MVPRHKVYAGMATMPTRIRTFRLAVASILPQVDRLFLFLDRFPETVRPEHPKITVLRSQEYGDLRANGKLLGLTLLPEPGCYLTVDDDILYPPTYAETMTQHLSKLGGGRVAGLHGSHLNRDGFESYLRGRMVVHRDRRLDRYCHVDIVATCSAAFRTEELHFDVRQWKRTNMVDLHFAIECQKRGLERVAVPRERKWVQTLGSSQEDSIYARLKRDDSVQTELARELIALSMTVDKRASDVTHS